MDEILKELMNELECTTGMAILLYKKNNDIEHLNILLDELGNLRNLPTDDTEYKDQIDVLIESVEFIKTNPTGEQLKKHKIHIIDTAFMKASKYLEEKNMRTIDTYLNEDHFVDEVVFDRGE